MLQVQREDLAPGAGGQQEEVGPALHGPAQWDREQSGEGPCAGGWEECAGRDSST